MANELATQSKPTGIATYLGGDAVKKNIAGVIGEKNVTRFVSSVVSAVQANPALAKCTNASILSAALQGEALQLAPSPQLGQFYLVPYRNKKKVGNQWVDVDEAQYQLGWRGYLQLAIRSGQYKSIVVSDVKEGEIEYNPITEEIIMHPIMDPAVREGATTIGYYAMFELINGFKKEMFSHIETIQAHAKKYSRGYRYDLEKGNDTSPWSTNFDAMAKKTMLRQLIGRWGIMSVEMQKAYTSDMGVIDDDGQVRYVDSPQAVDVEVKVQEDIEANANKVEFDEEPEILPAPETPTTPVPEPEKPKRGRPAKAAAAPVRETASAPTPTPAPVRASAPTPVPEPEIVPTVIDIPDDDAPEWG